MLKDVCIVVALCGTASAQLASRPAHMDRATLQQSGLQSTVFATAPLPLFQAISAIRQEYGWRISWEAAPGYSHFDVVDDTGPKWRAAHPDAKGVTRPAGGMFTSTFQGPSDASQSSAEGNVLSQVIQDYNATDNPGKYALRTSTGGWFNVVGIKVKDDAGALQEVTPLLDTPITVEKQQRTLYDTVRIILETVSTAANKKVIIMSVPNNLFRDTHVIVGGRDAQARDLLQQALDGTHRLIQYDLGFDPDVPVYILNVSVAARGMTTGNGERILVPVDRPH